MPELHVDFPWGIRPGARSWTHGQWHSVDNTEPSVVNEDDLAEVLYQWTSGDTWDGTECGVIRLTDGRLVAWETWYGATGSGFSEDAYGGDAVLYFASKDNLKLLVNMALSDEMRRAINLPEELWSRPEGDACRG